MPSEQREGTSHLCNHTNERVACSTTQDLHPVFLEMCTDFFSRALSGHFSVSKDHAVFFPEHHPAVLKVIIEFCYTAEFKWLPDEDESSPYLLAPLKTYKIADCIMILERKPLVKVMITNRFAPLMNDSFEERIQNYRKEKLREFFKAVYA